MPEKLIIALAQLNPTVGDVAGNIAKLRAARQKAAAEGADLVITSELYVSGYPPEDLVLKPSFQETVRKAVEELAEVTADGGPALLVGTPWREEGKLRNGALLLDEGRIVSRIFKCDLPNYGVFDEKRLFAAASLPKPVDFRGVKLGVLICEDMWSPAAAAQLKKQGAQILLVPSASPYDFGKQDQRLKLARERVTETGLPLAHLNQVGGQDDLVFDGASFVLDAGDKCVAQAGVWVEDILLTSWDVPSPSQSLAVASDWAPPSSAFAKATADGVGHKTLRSPSEGGPASRERDQEGAGAIYHALMIGLRDYVNKNGFPGVVIGLSGGIDSALVAVLAVDALGADKVWTVMMPSPYTSTESLDDATAVAKALGCRFDSIHITAAMEAFGETLGDVFKGRAADTAEENIQSRSRGIILMALSNKFGPMVLSTGNKSEMSVGYATLYGDMCGGFAVLKDLYKTQVYEVARWRNAHRPESALGPKGAVIPERIFTKAPTAELKPDQKDQDSLPPYETLDAILECLIEKDLGIKEIIAKGFDAATVKRVWAMLDSAEYKRRQAPPGVKITRRSLGKDRRYPITNKYKES